MRSRLGFAVAINVEPDVLVIDEALSAGDLAFKKKAIQRMYDLKDSGSTVLFVSHSMGMVKRFCTEAVLLHRGKLLTAGGPEEVVDCYEEMIAKSQEMQGRSQRAGRKTRLRDSTRRRGGYADQGRGPRFRGVPNGRRVLGRAEIFGLELLDEDGRPAGTLSRVRPDREGAPALRGGRGGQRLRHCPPQREGRARGLLD